MKTPIAIIVIISFVLVGGFLLINKTPNKSQEITNPEPNPSIQTKTDIKASFIIITDTITRNFTNPKYHNQSEEVFITKDDPSIIFVKKSGITYTDFFNTLPMKLSKDCLVTGDGETLCHKENGTLKFFLNEIEDKDLLDKEIKDGDKVRVKFTSN